MSLGIQPVDPDAAVSTPVSIEWAPYLNGAAITGSVWSFAPTGLTLSGQAFAGTVATCRVSGAVEGRLYELTNRVTLNNGAVQDRSVTLRGVAQ